MTTGKVWLVGAGPGDPGLITVRGRELLGLADVVLYDALSHPELLQSCPSCAELRDVGKLGGRENPDQSWITNQLIELARAGKRVVRLKGGDSFLFARGAEEAEALAAAGVPFEVVPGLSSPVGTSAYAGIPLTHRESSSSVTFITGTDRAGKVWSDGAWKKLATATDTLCVLMGMRRLTEISRAIIGGGRDPDTPVAIVQWGARPNQRVLVTTLARVAEDARREGFKNPAVVIIGEVVKLRSQLNWYESLPLFGQRVLVPRPAHQTGSTLRAIRERGAEPVVFPVIEIHDPPDVEPLRKSVRTLGQYDWVLFTSANGVQRFFAELARQDKDARALGHCKLGVIGPKTGSALAEFALKPDLVAREFVAERFAQDLLASVAQRAAVRVLIPRALVAREELPQALRAAGMSVDVVPVYETKAISEERGRELASLLERQQVDTVMFTSSSIVQSTAMALGSRARSVLSSVTVACIGPVTSGTARKLGIKVDVTASVYTVDGLLDALAEARASLLGLSGSSS